MVTDTVNAEKRTHYFIGHIDGYLPPPQFFLELTL